MKSVQCMVRLLQRYRRHSGRRNAIAGRTTANAPLTCWMPSFSTNPGGKIRLANARRKMAENSVSRPPIPMSSNLKFGARMAFGGALLGEEVSG